MVYRAPLLRLSLLRSAHHLLLSLQHLKHSLTSSLRLLCPAYLLALVTRLILLQSQTRLLVTQSLISNLLKRAKFLSALMLLMLM